MAINKKEDFRKAEVELAFFSKLLSHPARVAILKELARKESATCGSLVDGLPLAQSTVSQHLKELAEGGLVKMKTEGVKSVYTLNRKNFEKLVSTIEKFFTKTNN